MTDLAEFLLARIAEDEVIAKEAAHETHGRWVRVYQGGVEIADPAPRDYYTVVHDEGSPSEQQADHIARHDPARVLAECDAKRRLIQNELELKGWMRDPEDVLVFLALPYADHPDYREEWKP